MGLSIYNLLTQTDPKPPIVKKPLYPIALLICNTTLIISYGIWLRTMPVAWQSLKHIAQQRIGILKVTHAFFISIFSLHGILFYANLPKKSKTIPSSNQTALPKDRPIDIPKDHEYSYPPTISAAA